MEESLKRKILWLTLSIALVVAMLLASCGTATSTTISTTTTSKPATTSTGAVTTSATAATTKPTSTSTNASGNWWDKLGTPQYGGTMTFRINRDLNGWDPYAGEVAIQIYTGWMEQLFAPDYTIDPAVQSYNFSFWPNEQAKGQLVQTWEFPTLGTLVLHLRQGIHWQNIPPANGREFVASDVSYHFNRMLGLGDGYTKPAPMWASVAVWRSLLSVTADDKYTVTMKWSTNNPEFATENLQAPDASNCVESPDAVKQWGDLNDWHHAIGTGPWVLTDFVAGSSATMARNSTYWGTDEHFPKNQLPYADTLRMLIIPDDATALAALRTGKIDIMDQMSLSQGQSLKKTNPEIVQISYPNQYGTTLDPRNDKAPFNDIRVREALQVALDLPTISTSYYGGNADPWPMPLTSNYMKGWGFPYSQWPQDLKDQYAYNPTLAKKLLSDAGYPTGFKTDIVASLAGDMDLIQIVKSYYSAVGIDMEIRTMDDASFSAFVVSGHKNDALANRLAGSLGLVYYPLRQFTRMATGAGSNLAVVADPVYDAFYTKALGVTSTADLKQVLTDCNKYVAQQHFVVSLLQPMVYSFNQPWLKGYNAQYSAVTGSAGPQFLCFWPARFWIDQNVKKSLGR